MVKRLAPAVEREVHRLHAKGHSLRELLLRDPVVDSSCGTRSSVRWGNDEARSWETGAESLRRTDTLFASLASLSGHCQHRCAVPGVLRQHVPVRGGSTREERDGSSRTSTGLLLGRWRIGGR